MSLTDEVARAVRAATVFDAPFRHMTIDGVFPADVYREMLAEMPDNFVPVRVRDIAGHGSRRERIDLAPTPAPSLPLVWMRVAEALRSDVVRDAFVE